MQVLTNKLKFGMWLLENVPLPWSIIQTRQDFFLPNSYYILYLDISVWMVCYRNLKIYSVVELFGFNVNLLQTTFYRFRQLHGIILLLKFFLVDLLIIQLSWYYFHLSGRFFSSIYVSYKLNPYQGTCLV